MLGLTGAAISITKSVISLVLATITITFLTFFMLLEGPAWMDRFYGLLPERLQPRWRRIGHDVYRTVGGYVSGNLLISLIAGTLTTAILRRRYGEVMDAFLRGVEGAEAAGRDLAGLASVASFFVSRVDTAIDHRLDAIGSVEAKALRGRAAIANARLAFRAYEEIFTSERWRALAQDGVRPQRPLWASTGVKDPAYPDTRYVLELVTNGVVNTMPEATLRAVADHGALRGDTVHPGYDEAAEVMTALANLGIDYDAVMRDLEHDGLTIFQASWSALADTLEHKLAAARRGGEEDGPP